MADHEDGTVLVIRFEYALLNLSLRMMLWVAPVILYLRYVDDVNPLEYLRLTSHVWRGVLVALVLTW